MPISTEFDELSEAFSGRGTIGALDFLVEELRRQSRYHELYEALKMRARVQLGLPISPSIEALSEEKRTALEDSLVNACREVGGLLLKSGNIRDGWLYYRPVGERDEVAKLLKEIPVTHDNVDDMVQVLLTEGIDPCRGFDLALQFFGTCQSITLFDQEIVRHPLAVQRHAAARLVAKVHEDLLASVEADVKRQVTTVAPTSQIADWITDRDWLFENNAYHIDTTHLAAVVRFAKVLTDPESLALALDLTAYGAKLAPQFHYASEEPFGELYSDHAVFFRTLLGLDVEQGLAHFREKAKSLDVNEYGAAPVEVYVDLLSRTGRPREALLAAVELFPTNARSVGLAPTLLDLAKAGGDFEPLLSFCRSRSDLLGYTAGLIENAACK